MPRRIATVSGNVLSAPDAAGAEPAPIALDTPEWQAWLADTANCAFAFASARGGLTVRRERRGGGDYWYGYRSVAGRLRKAYIGRGADLTTARLEAAAQQLAEGWGLPPPAAPPAARPILAARLRPPPLRADNIPRPRIDRMLDAGLSGALTLLVAPAGFGKTAALTALADRQQVTDHRQQKPSVTGCLLPAAFSRVAWLSLTCDDNHPAQLLRDLAAALGAAAPGLGARTLAALALDAQPAFAMSLLIDDLAKHLPPCLLILDAYHQLRAPEAHALISLLLDQLLPNLHLLIAAREPPPLPLARLRARGQLSELGAADLRFTRAESAAWLRGQVRPDLTEAELAALEAHSEGWAAAIQMAALALRGRPHPGALPAALASSERPVADYLAEEVLAALSPATYALVLRTAILDQLSADLCAALLETADTRLIQQQLEDLERRNLFLLPLDDARRWFRYHPLFATVLRRRLAGEIDAPAVAGLHRRAAAWMAAAGLAPQAIGHALAAGQPAQAGAMIANQPLGDLLRATPQPTLHGWLAALPESITRTSPHLCLLQAWVLLERHDLTASARWLHHAEVARSVNAPGRPDSQGVIIMLDLARRVFYGQIQYMAAARQALEQLPTNSDELLALLHLLIGSAAAQSGNWAQAHASFLAVGRHARQVGSAALSTAAEIAQIYVELIRGDLPAAAANCRRTLTALANQGPLGDLAVLLRLLAQEVAREQGLTLSRVEIADLAAAGAQLGDVDGQILSATLTARAALSCGDDELARRAAQALDWLAADQRRPLATEAAAAIRTQIALHHSDLSGAADWLRAAPLSAPTERPALTGVCLWEPCALAPMQLQLAQMQQDDDHVGWQALLDLIAQATARHRLTCGLRVRLLTMRALALGGLGDLSQARRALRDAITLAAPGGFVAPFRELAPALHKLCAQLQPTPSPPEDEAVLGQLSRLLNDAGTDLPLGRPASGALTARERDVLALLATGASNRAIAARLILSEGTVKGYIHTIFDKLGTRSRTQAAARARALGLL